jgi:hypothetical protein
MRKFDRGARSRSQACIMRLHHVRFTIWQMMLWVAIAAVYFVLFVYSQRLHRTAARASRMHSIASFRTQSSTTDGLGRSIAGAMGSLEP